MRAGSLLRVCAIIVPAFILIACASGGGPGTDSNGNSEAVQIRAPLSRPGFGTGSNPQTATSNSPNFGAGPSPASGTAFPLFENVIAVVPENTAIGDDVRFGSPVTLTTRGGNFELNIPELGIDATLPGDGTTVNVTGGKLTLGIEHRNYLLEGVWAFQSSDPQAIESADFAPFIAGYVTPQTNVPRVGTATYSSAGGVDGIVNVRSGGGVASATLTGDVNFTVNFYADTFTGTLTNVTAVDVN